MSQYFSFLFRISPLFLYSPFFIILLLLFSMFLFLKNLESCIMLLMSKVMKSCFLLRRRSNCSSSDVLILKMFFFFYFLNKSLHFSYKRQVCLTTIFIILLLVNQTPLHKYYEIFDYKKSLNP